MDTLPARLHPWFADPIWLPHSPSIGWTLLQMYPFFFLVGALLAAVGTTLGVAAGDMPTDAVSMIPVFLLAFFCTVIVLAATCWYVESAVLRRVRAVAFGPIVTRTSVIHVQKFVLLVGMVIGPLATFEAYRSLPPDSLRLNH